MTGAPGADDNASGTAAVLEAARVLKEFVPEKDVWFALWDGEEAGLRGSRAFTQFSSDVDRVVAVINLDMI